MNRKFYLFLILLLVVFAGAFFYVRSDYFSGYIREKVIPEVSRRLNVDIDVQGIRVNPFPAFIDFKNVKISDGRGVISIKRMRMHLQLTGLLRKDIVIPVIDAEGLSVSTDLDSLMESPGIPLIKEYSKKGAAGSGWGVSVGNIFLSGAEIRVVDKKSGDHLELSDMNLSGNLKRGSWVIRKARLSAGIAGHDNLAGAVRLRLSVKKGGVSIEKLHIAWEGSGIDLKGRVQGGIFKGKMKISLLMRDLSKAAGLKLHEKGDVRGKGTVSLNVSGILRGDEILKNVRLDTRVKGGMFLQDLMGLLGEKEPLKGYASFKGVFKGTLDDPVAELTAVMKGGHIYGVDTEGVRCRISYRDGLMRFYDGKVRAYNGKASVEVLINLPQVTHYTLKVQAENLDSRGLIGLIGWDPGLSPGKVSGSLISDSSTFQPLVDFNYHSTGTVPSEIPKLIGRIDGVKGRFNLKDDRIMFSRLNISSAYSAANARGVVDLRAGTLDFETVLSTTNMGEIIDDEALSGTGVFSGKLRGMVDSPSLAGKVDLCRVSYKGVALGCLKAQLQYSPGYLLVRKLEGKRDLMRYVLRGSISNDTRELFVFDRPLFDMTFTFSGLPLDAIRPHGLPEGIKGTVSGSGVLKGYTGALYSKGNLEVGSLSYSALKAAYINTGFSYRDGWFNLKDFQMKSGNSSLRGDFRVSEAGKFSGRDVMLSISARDFLKDLPLGVKVVGAADFGGDIKSPEGFFNGDILVSEGNTKKGFRKEGAINIKLDNGMLSLNSGLFNERLVVSAEARMDRELPWRAKISIKEGRYEKILGLFVRDLPDDTLLYLKGTASAGGNRGRVKGFLRLENMKLVMYGNTFVNTDEIRLSFDGPDVTIDALQLKAGPAQLGISGGFGVDSGYNLTLYGSSYLGPLKSFLPSVEYLRGYSEFVLEVEGAWKFPVMNGGISLQDVSVGVKGLDERITSMNGYAYIDNNRLVLEDLSFRFASGSVKLKGVGKVRGFGIKGYHFGGKVQNVILRRGRDIELEVSGDLSLVERNESPSLIGDLRIIRAMFKKNIGWKDWIIQSPAVKTKTFNNDFIGGIELNVNLYGDKDIYIRNNIVDSTARVDLVLTGTVREPNLIGRIALNGGKVYFRNNEFTVIKASADFTDPTRIHPFFDIKAETRVKGYNIRLSLQGYQDMFDLSLTSDPVLDEVDILSLLTVGKLGEQLRGIEGGIGAAEAASFLAGSLQETVEERIRNLTGFDRFQVEPYVSESTGEVGPKITVSKRLLSDRLYVTYTTSLGEITQQFLRLEFLVNKSISLVGEREEDGTLGADIKFHFDFR